MASTVKRPGVRDNIRPRNESGSHPEALPIPAKAPTLYVLTMLETAATSEMSNRLVMMMTITKRSRRVISARQ